MLAQIEVPAPLTRQYRRCLSELTLVRSPADSSVHGSRTARGPEAAAQTVLAELRETARIVLESLAPAGGRTPVSRFLTCRLDRLAIAADDIATAAAATDNAALRQSTLRFRALAMAMWRVQLALCGTPLVSESLVPRPRPREVPAQPCSAPVA